MSSMKDDAIEDPYAHPPMAGKQKKEQSECGKYELVIDQYETGPSYWPYSACKVYVEGDFLTEIRHNYPSIPHAFVLDHPTGDDFLLISSKYQGQGILNLRTGEYRFAPDALCWAALIPSPTGAFFAVDGCYWGGPYELFVYDLRDPTQVPFPLLHRFEGDMVDGTPVWISDRTIKCKLELTYSKAFGKMEYRKEVRSYTIES